MGERENGQERYYCSRECQMKDWKLGHKLECGKEKKETASQVMATERAGESKFVAPPRYLYDPSDLVPLMAHKVHKPVGLTNKGNTCFLNSVLQCISGTPVFRGYSETAHHSKQCRRPLSKCFACEMESFTKRVGVVTDPFPPDSIIRFLPELNDNFCFGAQEDAHECMRTLVRGLQDAEVSAAGRIEARVDETTAVHQMFGGYLESRIFCPSCSAISKSYEPCLDLSLEITEATDSLNDVLETYTAPEKLSKTNMYRCSSCKNEVQALKLMSIHLPPPVLCIHLKRFKINKFISYEEELNLKHYCTQYDDAETPLYTLCAVLVHLDMFNISSFGHYISYVKDSTGQWHRIDDAKVTPVPKAEALGQRAYMLFYQRRGFKPAPIVRSQSRDASRSGSPVEEAPVEPANGPSPCVNGCGFYGSDAAEGYCSLCYKKVFGKNPPPVEAPKSPVKGKGKSPMVEDQQDAKTSEQIDTNVHPPTAKAAHKEAAIPDSKPMAPQRQASGGVSKGALAPGRNDPCPCGSTRKYKKCHGK